MLGIELGGGDTGAYDVQPVEGSFARDGLGTAPPATAVPKMPVDGRCEDVIFFDGVFFESSLTSIFFAP